MSLLFLNKEKKRAPQPLDLVNYKKQGCLAVDMTCVAIMEERMRGKEPKTIILHTAYYEMFQAWVAREYGEETAMKDFFIDGVEIRRERISTGKSLQIEYLEPVKC